jgi:ParB family transcriptional regulator, chromosome partitioning protein
MSEKRRALGRGLGALIPSSPGTARPVDVFFRESSPTSTSDGAEPSEDPQEHPNGYGHDTSRNEALTDAPVHHEQRLDATEGDQPATNGGEPETSGAEPRTDAPEPSTEAAEAGTDSGEGSTDVSEVSTDAGEARTEAGEARTGAGEARTDGGEVNGRGVPEQHRDAQDPAGGRHTDVGPDDRLSQFSVDHSDGLKADGASPAHQATGIGGGQDDTGGVRHVGDDGVASEIARDLGVADTSEAGLAPVPGATFAILPIAAIRPNPRQPRTVFDEEELAELAASIREIGVLQPVVVRPIAHAEREGADHHAGELHDGIQPDGGVQPDGGAQPDGGMQPDRDGEYGSTDAGPRFELIMGERRLRASELAGLDTIPAIVKETHDDDLLRDALLENLHRTQLNPLEEAAAYQQLLDDFGCSHDELASRIGRSRPQISNTIRLLRLPPLVARRLAAGVLSAGHARALLGLDDGAAMERLAQRIVAEGLSVRSVEEIVALGGDDPAAVPKTRRPRAGTRHPQLDDLAARLSDRYDTRVTIALGQRKGRLTVEFASVEDLNRIVGLMERI